MPIPRNQNRVAVRRDAPTGGERIHQPEPLHCDTCGIMCSRYNRWGRCFVCIGMEGWPENPIQVAPDSKRRIAVKGHVAGCQCHELRRPLLDDDGNQKKRNMNSPVWVLDVTCPDCGVMREVRTDGNHARWCVTGYVARCFPCSIMRMQTQKRVAA